MTENMFKDMFNLVDEFKADTTEELTAEYEDIRDDLLKWLMVFSKDDKLDWLEMKKLLTPTQLKRFKKYIGDDERVRVRRIDALNRILEYRLREIAEMFAQQLTKFETELYEETYYRLMYETQKEDKSYWYLIALLIPNIKTKVLNSWVDDNMNFVTRINVNWEKLYGTVKKELAQLIIQGKSPESLVTEISKQFQISINQAKTIVNTESTRVVSQATHDSMKAFGVEYYKLKAVLDNRTSKICWEMNGQVFKLSDFEIGVTASPFHPHCRTIEIPYKWEHHEGDSGKFTYQEWFGKYIRKG